MLRVALTNLLSNALRFSPPERLVRFVIDGRGEGDLAFHVSDDGPGIPVDEQTRLFEKYFRGRNSQAQPGAGLGLFLVQQVVNLHGGAVSVVSAPDLQTCFTLTIPLPKATRYPVHQAASGNRRI
jgi:signal transduction histidine kinase